MTKVWGESGTGVGSGNYPGGGVDNKVLNGESLHCIETSYTFIFHFFLAERYAFCVPFIDKTTICSLVMTNEMFKRISSNLFTMETNRAEQSVCRVSAHHRCVHNDKSWSYKKALCIT